MYAPSKNNFKLIFEKKGNIKYHHQIEKVYKIYIFDKK